MAGPSEYVIGKGVVSVRSFAATPQLWTATTAVLVGQTLFTAAGAVYNVVTAGTTSSTAPTLTTSTVTDGTATLAYSDWSAVGNCPKFEWKPDVKTLDHYTSQSFAMTQDAKVPTQIGGKLSIVTDEITIANLGIFAMGTPTGSVGSQSIDILSKSGWQGAIKCVGTNSIGKRKQWTFNNVLFIPDKAVSVIDTKFMELELAGDTLIDPNGKFGTVLEIA
jgi:hypothetical protein